MIPASSLAGPDLQRNSSRTRTARGKSQRASSSPLQLLLLFLALLVGLTCTSSRARTAQAETGSAGISPPTGISQPAERPQPSAQQPPTSSAGIEDATGGKSPVPVPRELPVQMLDGSSRTLGDFRGKVLVLSFWTIHCGPCRAEMPHLQVLYQTLQPAGLELLAVNLDEARETSGIRPTLRRSGYSFPVALDPEGQLAAPFNPSRMTPYTVVIDRSGIVRYSHAGYRAGDELALSTAVRSALKAPHSPGAP